MLIRVPQLSCCADTCSFGTFLGTLCRTSSRTQTMPSDIAREHVQERLVVLIDSSHTAENDSDTTNVVTVDHPERPNRYDRTRERRYKALSARLPLDMMEDPLKRSERLLFSILTMFFGRRMPRRPPVRPVCPWTLPLALPLNTVFVIQGRS